MRRAISRLVGRGVVLAAALFVYGCGGGGGSGDGDSSAGTGTLRVSLTDAPACGYESVNVTVAKVRVHQSAAADEGQPGWSEILVEPPRRLDLLSLSNGVLFELGQVALPAGKYQQLRLVLADNATSPLANTVVPTGGTETPLDTPSAQQSGIKLQANVDVPAGETADVVLDFDACRSVVRRGNSGRYGLKPVIAVVPMVSAGSISGYAAALPAVPSGVKVSAQVGGQVVKETVVASGAQFRLFPVPAGAYDVVFTAEGHATRVVSGVPVSTGVDTVMSSSGAPIALPLSGMGTVAGKVLPAEAQASVRALQSTGATSKIEVASVNADGQTGDYLLMLPIDPVAVATPPTWPSPPALEASSYTFVPVDGSAATYQVEASATGFVTSAPQTVTVDSAGLVSADFSLDAVP